MRDPDTPDTMPTTVNVVFKFGANETRMCEERPHIPERGAMQI